MQKMKNKLLSLLIITFVSIPLTAFANSDDSQYPATNFEPKVIFADESAESSEFDSDFPAANFQPKILYVDASAAKASGGVKGEKSVFDPKYPAANFEPKVIYP
jgi:hypothetical protein